MYHILCEVYSEMVGRGIFSNDLQRDLNDCLLHSYKSRKDLRDGHDTHAGLFDAFIFYDEGSHHDEHLTSLFAALFIHHHPDYINEELPPGNLSELLPAVRSRARSYFCRTRHGKSLPCDPIAAGPGESHEYYVDGRKNEVTVKLEIEEE
ncbi:hypothetical protein AUEXF2481DRAFT_30236 [Aureobasidium subglaciale EXF-2481]|uniref:Uncharacterized protein n=1 Tax=Aureobasidium subglaciale (strain EXF-2481) TaxID=1043005 RepID=A0A074Y905_AURSE|nr:uncharacterized protein AUEXF2481DRAFT_30236 [Aureobasidium subglaciale EXF-2481]KEQ94253.1 hypothetical protein AUEXF2481DRAFT_30236 [Aureobasidium subglaciale EXF-2481]